MLNTVDTLEQLPGNETSPELTSTEAECMWLAVNSA